MAPPETPASIGFCMWFCFSPHGPPSVPLFNPFWVPTPKGRTLPPVSHPFPPPCSFFFFFTPPLGEFFLVLGLVEPFSFFSHVHHFPVPFFCIKCLILYWHAFFFFACDAQQFQYPLCLPPPRYYTLPPAWFPPPGGRNRPPRFCLVLYYPQPPLQAANVHHPLSESSPFTFE